MNVRTSGAISPDPEVRVRLALAAAHESLALAAREAEGAGADKGRLRWVALGIVSALQGTLVAALSGYDTAETQAILHPSQPDRIAPVALLLRRARSQEYLNPPERVDLSQGGQGATERMLAARNAAVHALSLEIPESFASDAQRVLGIIRHLVLDAPAFDAKAHGMMIALLRDDLGRLSAVLEAIKPA